MFFTGRLAPFRFEFNAIDHEADGGQEDLDGRCVSLPSGLPGAGVACGYRAKRSCLASDFVVLVLSEAVLSETVLVLGGYLNCGDADR